MLYHELSHQALQEGVPLEQYVLHSLARNIQTGYTVRRVSDDEIVRQKAQHEALLEELGPPATDEEVAAYFDPLGPAMTSDKTTLYLASFCHVEGFISVFCLKDKATQDIFFHCDWCGLTWRQLPWKQVKTASDLEHEHIAVLKKEFDWKHITPDEYRNDSVDSFYFYHTGVSDEGDRSFLMQGYEIPTYDELVEAGLEDDLIYRDEKDTHELNEYLEEMFVPSLVRAKQYQEALVILTRIVGKRPRGPKWAYRLRAEAYRELNQHELAKQDEATLVELLKPDPPIEPPTPEQLAKRQARIEAYKKRSREREIANTGLDEAKAAHLKRMAASLMQQESSDN